LKKNVKEWTQTCILCQPSKISRHTKNIPVKISDQRFLHVLDVVGPLLPCKNFRYCLTLFDRFSRWLEAIHLIEASAELIATVFYIHWVARGSPINITMDQGLQCEAFLFKALTNLLGCERIRISVYHPTWNFTKMARDPQDNN